MDGDGDGDGDCDGDGDGTMGVPTSNVRATCGGLFRRDDLFDLSELTISASIIDEFDTMYSNIPFSNNHLKKFS